MTQPFFDEMYKNEYKQFVSNRLFDRLQYIESEMGFLNPFQSKNEIYSCLKISNKMSLLHMDIRPDNILVLQGEIKSLIDWTYAMVGDPYFELCRIQEFDFSNDYKLFDEQFIKGYENYERLRNNTLTELIYHLDASVMVLILFYENEQFKDRLDKQAIHVKEIYKQISDILNE